MSKDPKTRYVVSLTFTGMVAIEDTWHPDYDKSATFNADAPYILTYWTDRRRADGAHRICALLNNQRTSAKQHGTANPKRTGR